MVVRFKSNNINCKYYGLENFIISILGSGVVTALVNGLMNHRTQIIAIKESGLYAKRAEILDGLMRRLETMDKNMKILISPLQLDGSKVGEENRRQTAADSFNDFLDYYQANRHYLPKQLSDEIGLMRDNYKVVFTKFIYQASPTDGNHDVNLWSDLVEKLKNEITVKREEITQAFRDIIGVK